MSIIPYAVVFWAIVVGLPIGIAATVMLLMRFRGRIARSMRETAREESARLTAGESTGIGRPALPAEAQFKANLLVDFARPEEVLAGDPATSRSAALAKRQVWRVALVYAVAGGVLAVIMVNILRLVSNVNPSEKVLLWHLLYFAAFSWAFATPAVLAAAYVIRKQARYLVMAVLGLLAVVWLWDFFMLELFTLWLWVGAVPTAIALLLATRRLRAVGPVVIVGAIVWAAMSFVLIGAVAQYAVEMVGFRLVGPDLQGLDPFAAGTIEKAIGKGPLAELFRGPLEEIPHRLGEFFRSGEGRIFTYEHPERETEVRALTYAGVAIAFLAGAAAAWAAVSWLASRHRRRRASRC